MKSAKIDLSNPADFFNYQAILLSAPGDMWRYENAAEPAAEFQPKQQLFGYDAQLPLFAAALHRAGLEAWFLPAPDIFSSPRSFEHLRHLVGIEGQDASGLLHLCFGTPWTARILKGATNLMVIAGSTSASPFQLGRHPFGSGYHVPGAIMGVLSYDGSQAPLRTPNEQELPTSILSDAFTEEAFSITNTLAIRDPSYDAKLRSEFQVQSAAEFSAADWNGGSAAGSVPSLDFRRALIRRNIALPGEERPPPIVLMPWNLANPVSMIPDIAMRLSSDTERRAHDCCIILLPYNDSGDGTIRMQSLAVSCRSRASPGCVETIFFARVTSLHSIPSLRAIVTACWLDGSDPEWRWNARRLSQLGFGPIVTALPSDEPDLEEMHLNKEVASVFPAEHSHVIRFSDGFGERIWQGHTLSMRGMRRVLQFTRAAVAKNDARPRQRLSQVRGMSARDGGEKL